VSEWFYVQDTRSACRDCGGSALWWLPGGEGYTCDLQKAMRVQADWKPPRETDVLRRCSDIDSLAVRRFDAQNFREINQSSRPVKGLQNDTLAG
jgi:hypothetical protein